MAMTPKPTIPGMMARQTTPLRQTPPDPRLPTTASPVAQERSMRPQALSAPKMPGMMMGRRVGPTGLPAQPSMPNGRPPSQVKPPRLG